MNCNDDYENAVSNFPIPLSKFDVMKPSNFHKVLKTSVHDTGMIHSQYIHDVF